MMRSLAVMAASGVTLHASAATVNIAAYTNDSGDTSGINTTATLAVAATTFTITLENNSASGVITQFYFETGDGVQGLGDATIQNTPGISFGPGATPGTPKGGIHNTVGGSWSGHFFSMGAAGPSPHNGLRAGESISVIFSRDASFDLGDLIAAINAHDTRLAMKYQEWGEDGEDSEWLVSTGVPANLVVVPLPPAAWAGLGTLGVIIGTRSIRRRRDR